MDSPKTNEEMRESSRSDVSAFTDMKVFQGHLGGNDLFKKLNEEHLNSPPQGDKAKTAIPAVNTAYLSKLSEFKDEGMACSKEPVFRLKALPFGSPQTRSRLDLISFGTGAELTGKPGSPIGNANEEDNRSNTSKQSRKSKSNMSLNDPLNDDNSNSANFQMKAFITTLNDEEDTCVTSEDKSESQHNIFSSMRHKGDEAPVNDSPNRNDAQAKPMKTFKKVVDSFSISKIEKGIALLVSSDDCIFTLPTFLLPHGAKIGNTYKFAIDENSSLNETEKGIQLLQQKLLNKA